MVHKLLDRFQGSLHNCVTTFKYTKPEIFRSVLERKSRHKTHNTFLELRYLSEGLGFHMHIYAQYTHTISGKGGNSHFNKGHRLDRGNTAWLLT